MKTIAKWMSIGTLGISGVSIAALFTGHLSFATICIVGIFIIWLIFVSVLAYYGQ